ncbi:MAG: DUF4303 domain-containing protein [Oscillospiraceae bacterium]|nr:DUF4303 domain-containing protein [Oscillospiraceae bacterium]
MMDITEYIRDFDCEPEDEYDDALAFALKKWIADMINSIPENGVYAAAVCFQMSLDEKDRWQADASFAYNTEDYLAAHRDGNPEAKWNHCAWKEDYFANADDSEAVRGCVKMWLQFKDFDVEDEEFDEEEVVYSFFGCAVKAVRELKRDGIFLERFGKDIPVLMLWGLEYPEENALFSAAANDISLLDRDFFEMCGCRFPK